MIWFNQILFDVIIVNFELQNVIFKANIQSMLTSFASFFPLKVQANSKNFQTIKQSIDLRPKRVYLTVFEVRKGEI